MLNRGDPVLSRYLEVGGEIFKVGGYWWVQRVEQISATDELSLIIIHKGILNISYVTYRFWQKYLFMFEVSLKNNFLWIKIRHEFCIFRYFC
jgi:hypothetical protein